MTLQNYYRKSEGGGGATQIKMANKISVNPSGTEQENWKLPFASVWPPNNFEHTPCNENSTTQKKVTSN